ARYPGRICQIKELSEGSGRVQVTIIQRAAAAIYNRHGADIELRARLPRDSCPHIYYIPSIDVFQTRRGLFNPTAFSIVSAADPQPQLILDQRKIHHRIDTLTWRTVLRKEGRDVRLQAKLRQVRASGDKTNCSTD